MMSSVIMSASTYFCGSLFLMGILFFMKEMGGFTVVMEWENSENFLSEMGLPMVVDWISCSFLMSVLYISGCVSLFSGFYMGHEKYMSRFMHLMQMFVFSMGVLIMFPGYMGLMVGWDGLGIVSFLLVIYYPNWGSLSAGFITAITNRVGDVFFLVAIGVMSSMLSYNYMGGMVFGSGLLSMVILLGSVTKSAQTPFSAWLPEAMAAPTPVSTLVHSSTLVTAGVYVLIRFSDYLGEAEKNMLMGLSMVTMLLAGTSGIWETDVKKVVAFSTLSQVGMMMFSISLGATNVAFFHLLVHAFFKALMFMCVGGVLYYSGGIQDFRLLGGLWYQLPLVSALFIFSNLSLMGFPFLSGFYSKELISGEFLGGNYSVVGFIMLLVSLSQTVIYGTRMVVMMLMGTGSSRLTQYKVESNYYLSCLLLMSHGAVVTALLLQNFMIEMMGNSFIRGDFLYTSLGGILLIILNLTLLGGLMKSGVLKEVVKKLFSTGWFLKEISGNFMGSKYVCAVSRVLKEVEMGWVRSFLWESGIEKLVMGASNSLRKMNFNSLGLVIFYAICVFLIIFF